MGYDPEVHHRQSSRWKGYDYSSRGLYFVTICTHRRLQIFSHIENRQTILSARGKAVQKMWSAIPERFPSVEAGPFVVMPNHLHGILAILRKEKTEGAATLPSSGSSSSAPTTVDKEGAASSAPTTVDKEGAASSAPTTADEEGAASSAPTLGKIIRAFKSVSAKQIHELGGTTGQVWQRNYYEHVIRDGREYSIICRYIWENPARWGSDPENSASKTPDTTPPWD